MGRSRDGGVEALAMESWKSGWGFEGLLEVADVMFDGGAVGMTTNSRHCGVFDCGEGLDRGSGPVGVSRV